MVFRMGQPGMVKKMVQFRRVCRIFETHHNCGAGASRRLDAPYKYLVPAFTVPDVRIGYEHAVANGETGIHRQQPGI